MVHRWPPTTSPSPQNGGEWAYANGHISATGDPIHFMFGSMVGFSGWRIERRYLRFEQIQDGSHRHVGKISNGHISATGRPIHFMFYSRVGFSGTADLMALFSIRTKKWKSVSIWRQKVAAYFFWPTLYVGLSLVFPFLSSKYEINIRGNLSLW